MCDNQRGRLIPAAAVGHALALTGCGSDSA